MNVEQWAVIGLVSVVLITPAWYGLVAFRGRLRKRRYEKHRREAREARESMSEEWAETEQQRAMRALAEAFDQYGHATQAMQDQAIATHNLDRTLSLLSGSLYELVQLQRDKDKT